MKTDKTMYLIIAAIFILFTIIQVFYFVNIQQTPTSFIRFDLIKNIAIFFIEAIVSIICIAVGVYYLPVLCVLELSTLFISLKEINISTSIENGYVYFEKVKRVVTKYRILQVIRC